MVHVRWFGGSVSTSPATPAPRRNDQHHRGSPVAADEHTNPAKLPCRRAVGSSRPGRSDRPDWPTHRGRCSKLRPRPSGIDWVSLVDKLQCLLKPRRREPSHVADIAGPGWAGSPATWRRTGGGSLAVDRARRHLAACRARLFRGGGCGGRSRGSITPTRWALMAGAPSGGSGQD